MSPVIAALSDGAARLVRGIGQIAALSMLALVLLVAGNVLGRYLFGLGSVALQEAEWHLMAFVALMGMSYGLNQGGEVRVDLAYARFGPRLRGAIDLISWLMLAGVAGMIGWLSLDYVAAARSIGEGSPDPGGLPARWLLKALLPLGFGLLTLQALAGAGHSLSRLLKGAHDAVH